LSPFVFLLPYGGRSTMCRFTKSKSKRKSSPSASFSIYKFKHGRALVRNESTLSLKRVCILNSIHIIHCFYEKLILPDTLEESSLAPSRMSLRRWEFKYSSSSFMERSVILKVLVLIELMISTLAFFPLCLSFSTSLRAARISSHPTRYSLSR